MQVPALSAVWLGDLYLPDVPAEEHYLSYSLLIDEKEVSRESALFCAPKHFKYADPNLTLEREGDTLIICSDAFVQAVEILCDDGDVVLSDNFFDMDPGEKRVQILRGNGSQFRILSMWDT